jgi:hypothetical protein
MVLFLRLLQLSPFFTMLQKIEFLFFSRAFFGLEQLGLVDGFEPFRHITEVGQSRLCYYSTYKDSLVCDGTYITQNSAELCLPLVKHHQVPTTPHPIRLLLNCTVYSILVEVKFIYFRSFESFGTK